MVVELNRTEQVQYSLLLLQRQRVCRSQETEAPTNSSRTRRRTRDKNKQRILQSYSSPQTTEAVKGASETSVVFHFLTSRVFTTASFGPCHDFPVGLSSVNKHWT